ncbi:M15 family metallopeptidase [Microbacterium indicum]|uniref:M15 family metallopeptidase n=1 Tax=Microbacterium indicum TaxID=358100 RepID=UPI0003FCD94D|nr:M15 family metallopeptidase [Microbacterium indicum]
MTPPLRSDARRAQVRRRTQRRRRRSLAALVALVSASVMIVVGAELVTSGGSAGAAPRPTETASPTATASSAAPGDPSPIPTADPSEDPDAAFCDDAVRAAVASGDADEVVRAAGGGEAFRSAVASGAAAECVALDRPEWAWVVVDKQRPIDPIDFAPELAAPSSVYSAVGATMTPTAAAALDELAAAVDAAGQGQVSLFSGYRSYATQVTAHSGLVAQLGQEAAERTSARPGYSEHQLGLAADLVACDGRACGTIYEFGDTAQGRWVAENAWRYGFILRYVEGGTATTGYEPEPWHLRYVGVELATAYAEGGYETYEDFWGLGAAPDYAD